MKGKRWNNNNNNIDNINNFIQWGLKTHRIQRLAGLSIRATAKTACQLAILGQLLSSPSTTTANKKQHHRIKLESIHCFPVFIDVERKFKQV